jgi:hypothetical protein
MQRTVDQHDLLVRRQRLDGMHRDHLGPRLIDALRHPFAELDARRRIAGLLVRQRQREHELPPWRVIHPGRRAEQPLQQCAPPAPQTDDDARDIDFFFERCRMPLEKFHETQAIGEIARQPVDRRLVARVQTGLDVNHRNNVAERLEKPGIAEIGEPRCLRGTLEEPCNVELSACRHRRLR